MIKKFKAILLIGSLFFGPLSATTPDGMPERLWDTNNKPHTVEYIGYDKKSKIWRIALKWWFESKQVQQKGLLAERKRYLTDYDPHIEPIERLESNTYDFYDGQRYYDDYYFVPTAAKSVVSNPLPPSFNPPPIPLPDSNVPEPKGKRKADVNCKIEQAVKNKKVKVRLSGNSHKN